MNKMNNFFGINFYYLKEQKKILYSINKTQKQQKILNVIFILLWKKNILNKKHSNKCENKQ